MHDSDPLWDALRSEFLISSSFIHLTANVLGAPPISVREAIARHRTHLDESPYLYGYRESARREFEARAAAAHYLGADPTSVALVESTTAGLGLAYGGVAIASHHEVLSTIHDHHSTRAALRYCAHRTGATLRLIRLYDVLADTSTRAILERIGAAIGEATRLLALSWVYPGTGLKLPVREIAGLVATVNRTRSDENRLIFALDGVQGFGVESTPVAELGCDLFAAGCHKWIMGPRGTGIVWATSDCWSRLSPTIPSFTYTPLRHAAHEFTPGGTHAFEHQWALVEAFEFHERVGRDAIAQRVRELAAYLKNGLSAIGKVTVHTPMAQALSSGIVCFAVEGVPGRSFVERLLERGVVASLAPKTHFVRMAPSIVNSRAELDRTVQIVEQLCR